MLRQIAVLCALPFAVLASCHPLVLPLAYPFAGLLPLVQPLVEVLQALVQALLQLVKNQGNAVV